MKPINKRIYIARMLAWVVMAFFFQAAHVTSASSKLKIYDLPYIPDQDVTIDGELNEAVWKNALRISLFVETSPRENIAANSATVAYIFENGENIYIAFVALDPEPERIRAIYQDQDHAWGDDLVGVSFDSFNDGQRAYQFLVNPLGSQLDLIQDDRNGSNDTAWNAIWESAGKLTGDGYQVEMAIPFKALNFPADRNVQQWGFEAVRFLPRDFQYRFSITRLDRNKGCHICQLPDLKGFENTKAGKNLEVIPSFTSSFSHNTVGNDADKMEYRGNNTDMSIDLRWGITPSATANLTLNPDFSTVESDSIQLSINTSSALYYPEKRGFFLENKDYFYTPENLFHSRNIVEPDYGLKFTGRYLNRTYGVYLGNDGQQQFLIPGNTGSELATLESKGESAVIRYRLDGNNRSYLGFFGSARQSDHYHNNVAGIDGRYYLNSNSYLEAMLLSSDSSYPDSIQQTYEQDEKLSGQFAFIKYGQNSRNWDAFLSHRHYDKGFRADMGFFSVADFSKSVAGAYRKWHGDKDSWWQKIRMGGDWDITHDTDGKLLEREIEASINVEGRYQSFFHLRGEKRNKYYDGVYFDQSVGTLNMGFKPINTLFFGFYSRFGDEIDYTHVQAGDILSLSGNLVWYIGKHLKTGWTQKFQRLDVAGGRLYQANVSELYLKWQFDTRSYLRWIAQWQDISRDPSLYTDPVDRNEKILANQLLYAYKFNPKTVFYAGYSDQGYDYSDHYNPDQTDQTLFIKLSYAWQL